MGKSLCECGYVIYDQTDFIPYKARLVPDQLSEKLFDGGAAAIAKLIEAIKAGKRQEWIEQTFPGGWAQNWSDAQLIEEVMSSPFWRYHRDVFQCEQCGRLWVQIGRANHYASFVPESPEGQNILAARADEVK